MPEQRRIGYQWNFCPGPTATSERENSTLGISRLPNMGVLHSATRPGMSCRDLRPYS